MISEAWRVMTLQEVLKSVDKLSIEEQTYLFDVLKAKLARGEAALSVQNQSSNNGETFWDMTLRFRQQIEEEGIEFTDEDFADLRDRTPGRKVEI